MAYTTQSCLKEEQHRGGGSGSEVQACLVDIEPCLKTTGENDFSSILFSVSNSREAVYSGSHVIVYLHLVQCCAWYGCSHPNVCFGKHVRLRGGGLGVLLLDSSLVVYPGDTHSHGLMAHNESVSPVSPTLWVSW